MARVLIAYYSRTGKTEQLARAVAEGAEGAGADVTLKSIEDCSAADLLDFDGIILGAPTYYGAIPWEMKRVIDDSVQYHGQLHGKVGGAFSTSANVGGGNETTVLQLIETFLIHGMIVQGSAQGDHYGPVAVGSPDTRSISQAKALGKRVADLAARLAS
jgi:NAD(P)H dehydrogenase (quinone)